MISFIVLLLLPVVSLLALLVAGKPRPLNAPEKNRVD